MAEGDQLLSVFQEFSEGKPDEKKKKGFVFHVTTAKASTWFKNAKLFGKNCTSNSLDIAHSKVRKDKSKKGVSYAEFQDLIKEMSASYGKDHPKCADAVAEMKEKLQAASPTGHMKQNFSKAGNVEGLTDTSKYTGAHKERFDESGKGKGAAGRTDTVENTGYVGNYKGEGTYKGN